MPQRCSNKVAWAAGWIIHRPFLQNRAECPFVLQHMAQLRRSL
jgi:hypothetical protein